MNPSSFCYWFNFVKRSQFFFNCENCWFENKNSFFLVTATKLTERIAFTTVSVKRKGFSNESYLKKEFRLTFKSVPGIDQSVVESGVASSIEFPVFSPLSQLIDRFVFQLWFVWYTSGTSNTRMGLMELISLFHQSPDILIIHLVKALMEVFLVPFWLVSICFFT